jgi:hypothetical protein
MSEQYCLVVMPFKEEFKGTYQHAIKAAVEETGLTCIRVDEAVGSFSIHRQIIELLCKAKVIVADLTGQNANVFYELGIAHALGNNVIGITRSVRGLPFDVRPYKVIEYTDSIAGGQQLKKHLQEAVQSIDQWSQKPSNPVQDFLPPDAQRVSFASFRDLQQQLREVREALALAKTQLTNAEAQQVELNRLREENIRLQGARQFSEAVFRRTGLFEDNVDMDRIVDEFLAELSNKGEVTVSIPPSSERPRAASKISFKKVEK